MEEHCNTTSYNEYNDCGELYMEEHCNTTCVMCFIVLGWLNIKSVASLSVV